MEKVKAGFIAFFTFISAWLGNLAIPVYILVCLNIADWLTVIRSARTGGSAAVVRRLQHRQKSACGFCGAWCRHGLALANSDTVAISLPFSPVVASLGAVWRLPTNDRI
jgi:hypothetical protein